MKKVYERGGPVLLLSGKKGGRRRVLSEYFFGKPTVCAARALLGKFLVRRRNGKTIAGMISETEAYKGFKDSASHASRGRTERNEVMFGKPGRWYVYLIYGTHYCLNVVTERENYPAAVLIRSVIVENRPRRGDSAIDAKTGSGFAEIKGPGRVCRYFGIDASFNKKISGKKTGLWIEERGIIIKSACARRGERIGIDYAGKCRKKLWRFFLSG